MKVYISGKIGEEVVCEATRQKFAKAEEMLKAKGYKVFNPTTSGLGKVADEKVLEAERRGEKTTWYQEILKLDLDALSFLPWLIKRSSCSRNSSTELISWHWTLTRK